VTAWTLGIGFAALSLALVPLFAYLALVTAAALFGRPRATGRGAGPDGRGRPRFAVVIPAHDEAANIGRTVASCLGLAYDRESFAVVVVADNCTDDTAGTARAAGAEVYERHAPDRRSKGYALEDFFAGQAARPEGGPFDAFVVIDADTLVDPGLLDGFAAAFADGDDWVQCYYTARNPDDTWRTRLLTYALSLFNGVWLLGQDRLGLGAGFRGNGMMFSARGLARVPWTSYGLVEDQEFSWTLRAAGERVRFLPGVRVYAEMVRRGRTAVSQRRRWEAGRKSLRSKFLGPVLRSKALGPGGKALSAVELVFPPLMPLMGLLALALLVHPAALAVPGLAPAARTLRPVHAAMVATTAAYGVSPFFAVGLPWRYAASLACVPYYAVWKVFATFGTRTRAWVRTPRESASHSA
jgi:Glycosyltransferase like family 2